MRILLQLESFVLRFDDGLAAQRFGLSFRVVHHGFGLLRRSLRGCVDQVAGDDEAEGDADDGSDDQPDEFGHTLPLSFQFPIERYIQKNIGIKNPGKTGHERTHAIRAASYEFVYRKYPHQVRSFKLYHMIKVVPEL